MPSVPRDYEAELRAVMDALAESVAEASDEGVLEETRAAGEDPRGVADRGRPPPMPCGGSLRDVAPRLLLQPSRDACAQIRRSRLVESKSRQDTPRGARRCLRRKASRQTGSRLQATPWPIFLTNASWPSRRLRNGSAAHPSMRATCFTAGWRSR